MAVICIIWCSIIAAAAAAADDDGWAYLLYLRLYPVLYPGCRVLVREFLKTFPFVPYRYVTILYAEPLRPVRRLERRTEKALQRLDRMCSAEDPFQTTCISFRTQTSYNRHPHVVIFDPKRRERANRLVTGSKPSERLQAPVVGSLLYTPQHLPQPNTPWQTSRAVKTFLGSYRRWQDVWKRGDSLLLCDGPKM